MTSCYSDVVFTGEQCTIQAAKNFIGLFDSNIYFKINDSNTPDGIKYNNDINKINKLIKNEKDPSLYSLCSIDSTNTIATMNCAISTKNPWMTIATDNINCKVPSIDLPSGFIYTDSTKTLIKKPEKIWIKRPNTAYCQERWYDWFTIPDYHLGNRYMKKKDSHNDNNIDTCLKPCNIGYVPKNNTDLNYIDKCIPRDNFDEGLYRGSFNYLPISLILLLGSTKDSLKNNHKNALENMSQYIANNNMDINQEVYDDLFNDASFDKLYLDDNVDSNLIKWGIKTTIKNSINNLLKLPFNLNNINIPDKNTIEISKPLITTKKIKQAYDICKNFYEISTNTTMAAKLITWRQNLPYYETNDKFTDNKWNKYFGVLKKACNIAFNGKSDYSSKYILYNLNKDKDINEVIDYPIEFIITSLETPSSTTLQPSTPYSCAEKPLTSLCNTAKSKLTTANAGTDEPAKVKATRNLVFYTLLEEKQTIYEKAEKNYKASNSDADKILLEKAKKDYELLLIKKNDYMLNDDDKKSDMMKHVEHINKKAIYTDDYIIYFNNIGMGFAIFLALLLAIYIIYCIIITKDLSRYIWITFINWWSLFGTTFLQGCSMIHTHYNKYFSYNTDNKYFVDKTDLNIAKRDVANVEYIIKTLKPQ